MSNIVEFSNIIVNDLRNRYTLKISIDRSSLRTQVVEDYDQYVPKVKIIGKVNILETTDPNIKLGTYNFNYYPEGKIQIPGSQKWLNHSDMVRMFDIIPNDELIEIFMRIITDNIEKIKTNFPLFTAQCTHGITILEKLTKTVYHDINENNSNLININKELQEQLTHLEKKNTQLQVELVKVKARAGVESIGGYKRRNTRRRNTKRIN